MLLCHDSRRMLQRVILEAVDVVGAIPLVSVTSYGYMDVQVLVCSVFFSFQLFNATDNLLQMK